MERIDFPLTGNSIIMAVVILIHVFFAFFAVGGTILAVASEWTGRRKNNDHYISLARKITKFLSDMMKVNGVLGVAIVVLTIGLWGSFARLLYSATFWLFLTEGIFFLVLMVFSILYHRTWDKVSPGRHLFYGIGTAGAAILTAFFINAVWAFMMVPGDWIVTQNRWDAFFTPIIWESFLHMIIPCVLNAALMIFIWTYWKSRTADHDQEYYEQSNKFMARIAGFIVFLQPLSGLSFLFKVKSSTQDLAAPNPWQQIWTGVGQPYLHTMMTLAGIGIIFAILYWIFGHKKGRKFLLITALVFFTAYVMGGYTREKARKPYLIWGTMPMNQRIILPSETKDENSGKAIYDKWDCGACHTLNGAGGNFGPELISLHESYTVEEMITFLEDPPEDMPPFDGSREETKALSEYLLEASRD